MALTLARTMPGVMELLPLDQIALQSMLDSIRRNFERFGFLPIETPVMEYTDVLLTKSGGETERQVYFVQSTGSLQQGGAPELALRFDLTVPLARYVAEHERELSFPFRRYQIQRVYRGESAQRGRFREFYQCDVDVIGKDTLSLNYDAEVAAVIDRVFTDLNIGPFTLQFNNRKIMCGFFSSIGLADADLQARVLREVDKLDKRGAGHVREVLLGSDFNLSAEQIQSILSVVQIRCKGNENPSDAFVKLRREANRHGPIVPLLEEGERELAEVIALLKNLGVPESHYQINFSVARGLDYYTGTVYETTLDNYPQIGSICSGGRYENLATHYTKSKLPGVGISIGATRLFWQLREAKLLPTPQSTVQVLVAQMHAMHLSDCLTLATQLRNAGINTELAMEASKLAKQFKYADRAGIRFVLVLGADEIANGTVSVKDLRHQEQLEVPRTTLITHLRDKLLKEEITSSL